MSYIF